MGQGLTPEEKLELFGAWSTQDEAYAVEAEQRWGETDAWKVSQRRTTELTKQDWVRVRRETADLEARIAGAVTGGTLPGSDAGMSLAEEHRQHMKRWFHEVPVQMHVGLGQMYVDDPRFAAYCDANVVAGTAVWLRDAITANAARIS